MVAGILVLLALVVGTVGLSSLVSSNLLGSREQGSSSEARSAAEAGIDEIIATWNQPQNRKLLVSGQAMSTWASSTNLQSPCVTTDGKATRPGVTGLPTTQAKSFGDGEFRDVENPTKANTGDRQFALVRVTYSAGPAANTNRRAISVSSTKTGGVTTVGPGFTGNFSDLNNLDDPDGTVTTLQPGSNSGFITVEVQGRVMRGGTAVATATVTREFEVLPKCCGASFGSNAATNLGADKRACGVEFGLITGINGGTHFSYYANDRFTTVNKANQVVNVSGMIGIVNPGQTVFDRASCRVGPRANSGTSGCPAGTSADPLFDSATDPGWRSNILSNSCGNFTAAELFTGNRCGTASDRLGTSISGIPIVPGSVTLPPVSTYLYSWTPNGWAANTIPLGNAAYQTLVSTNTAYRSVIRTRNDTTPPRVEICTAATCTNTSWRVISDDRIADSFGTGDYTGTSGNLNPWVGGGSPFSAGGPWLETDPTSGGSSTGKVRIVSNAVVFNADATASAANTMRLQRGLDLSGFTGAPDPRISFRYQGTNLAAADTLLVEASANGTAWVTLGTVAGNNTASTQTYTIPAAQVGTNTRIRFTSNSALTSTKRITLDDIQVAPRGGLNSWCEYSATAPVTSTPGFLCLGPTIDLSAGGTVIMDTTGGPLSFYYSEPTDTRGNTSATALLRTGNAATIQHVKCAVQASNACATAIPDSDPYSDVGVPDRLNFFGRDTNPGGTSLQYLAIGTEGAAVGTTGRISRAWFYFPWGALRLVSDGCATGATPAGFLGDNSWSINGRVWVSSFRPCGAFHFRIPPSSSVGLSAAFATGFNPDYVQWTGVDWVARAVTSSRNY
ncbi:hypothetical protein [Synechococcus sp. CS-1332]|uniref:hypothetical protein n=1 Tax=Synechococcus sp. CS-1332 TaxID=2847972 RepID=UPI00223A6E6A|nr:hypothetical protein [Synechococcus sp. CS-1332]MCT0207749.1 hypothetical protein [Synechococcus sp. CS-1332]